jgi:hypothetical protein
MIVITLILIAALAATAAGVAAEDRPHMKRVDVSPARPDRGDYANANDGSEQPC